MNHTKHALLLTFALGFGVANLPAQNLLQNGSFELGSWTHNSSFPDRMQLGNGASTINNWTTGGGSGNFWWIKSPSFNVQNGTYAIDLDSNELAPAMYIEQTFSTVIGQQYQVSAYFASEGNGGASTTSLLINGASIGSKTIGSGLAESGLAWTDLNWSAGSFLFTATSTSSTLRLLDATPNSYADPILDNISVSVVPEPSLGAFVLIAAFGFLVVRVFRSRPAFGSQAE